MSRHSTHTGVREKHTGRDHVLSGRLFDSALVTLDSHPSTCFRDPVLEAEITLSLSSVMRSCSFDDVAAGGRHRYEATVFPTEPIN